MERNIVEIDNGIILPQKYITPVFSWGLGGVIDKNGEYVDESGMNFPERFGGKYNYNYNNDECQKLEETVIYIGPLRTHWGHFLIDCSRRFWYILEVEKNYRIVYCGFEFEGDVLPANIIEFFKLLGVEEKRLLNIRKPTKIKKILIPSMLNSFANLDTLKYKNVFLKIKKEVNENLFETAEKLYYTRTGLKKEKEIGEKLIEKIFRKNGYMIVSPEQESVEKQIALMKSCKIFASIEGTLAHNIVFAEWGKTKQIILRKHLWINNRQTLINNDIGVDATYINIGCRPFGKKFPPDYFDGIFWLRVSKDLIYYCKSNNMWIPDRKEILLADIRCLIQYLIQCKKYVLDFVKEKIKCYKIDNDMIKKILKYKNIVIYGANNRGFRWKRIIETYIKHKNVFLVDSNYKTLSKYENIYGIKEVINLHGCGFFISIHNVDVAKSIRNILQDNGIPKEDIYLF